jgi:hypothetical protein
MKKSTAIAVLVSAVIPALAFSSMWSQDLTVPAPLQQKVQAIQNASRENQQRLQVYQWIETTTVTVNGNPMAPQPSICRYTSDGTVSKTPLGPQSPAPTPKGGPLKRHVEEKKIEEAQESLAEIRNLVASYLPLEQGSLQRAYQTNRVDFEHNGTAGNSVVIHDFVKPGDTLSLDLNVATMVVRHIRINSYFASPADVMSADVQFATLPDGTRYPAVTSITAPDKSISILTVQSAFSRPAQ